MEENNTKEDNTQNNEQPTGEAQEGAFEKEMEGEQGKDGDTQESPSGDMKLQAALAYLGILIIVPFLVAKDDPFVSFHLKQGVTLILLWAALFVVGIIPILGWIIFFFGSIFALILMIMGIINAANGERKRLPLIGDFAAKFEN